MNRDVIYQWANWMQNADRDKAVIFNVDICDYYFIILKYNIISQRFCLSESWAL